MEEETNERHGRMQGFLVRYDSYLSKVESALLLISAALIIIALITVGMAVLGRYFFNNNLIWSIELNEYIMLYTAFLTASWILKNDEHVQVDILTSRISHHTRRKFAFFTSILASVVCLIIFWYSLDVVIDNYQRGTVIVNVMKMPKFIPLLCIPVGSMMLFLRYIHKIGALWTNK